jgi:NitT/TauT family transport system substrate-binding protein
MAGVWALEPTAAHPEVCLMKTLLRSIALCLSLPLFGVACSKTKAETTAETGEKASAAPASASGADVAAPPAPQGPPLKVAYSDWPGWVAWEIAIQKGWFKEAGVPIEFKWFEYVPSMEAYSAGKVDAVSMTNGDALVTGSTGGKSVCIIANDYSNGNDMIIAKPGIKSIAELKGKKVGVEVGFVSHLLLLYALKSANLTEKDVKLVKVPTDQTPQALKSGQVDAIAAWQPSSGQALKEVAGSTALFTSKDVPGLIYDHLCVNPKSLAERRADWVKVAQVWLKVADFLADPKNAAEASKIMSARVGLTPEAYAELMGGTHYLGKEGNQKHFAKGDGLDSIFGSSKIVDEFNVKNEVYKTPMKIEEYFDPSVMAEASK